MDYSSEVVRRFRSPLRAGALADDTPGVVSGEAEDRSLHVWLRFQVQVRDRRIEVVRFQAFGCPHTIAAADWIAERLEGGDVQVRFDGVAPHKGVNYQAQRGSFLVTEGSSEFRLYPEKRRYLASDNVMTEAAIRAGFTRDVYISLGEALGNGDWAVRVQYKPFVRWIWLGALLMAFGGSLAVADARYRRLRHRTSQDESVPLVQTSGALSREGA